MPLVPYTIKRQNNNYVELERLCSSPYFVFSDKFNLVNAYNCAVLSSLAYKNAYEVEVFFNSVSGHLGAQSLNPELFPFDVFMGTLKASERFRFNKQKWFVDDSKSHTQGFFARSSTQVVIALRGTEIFEWRDWRLNSRFNLVSFSDFGTGKVHEGFLSGLRAVLAKLEPFLEENGCFDNNLEFIVKCGRHGTQMDMPKS